MSDSSILFPVGHEVLRCGQSAFRRIMVCKGKAEKLCWIYDFVFLRFRYTVWLILMISLQTVFIHNVNSLVSKMVNINWLMQMGLTDLQEFKLKMTIWVCATNYLVLPGHSYKTWLTVQRGCSPHVWVCIPLQPPSHYPESLWTPVPGSHHG